MPFASGQKRKEYNRKWAITHRTAVREHAHRHAIERRLILALFKGSEPCADCGNTFPPECMDFDHVRGKKKNGVSWLLLHRSSIIQREVEKCDLVCSNCHRIRTISRRRLVVFPQF